MVVAGTTVGTYSDNEGKFSLNVPYGCEIEISFLGSVTRRIPFDGSKNYFDITLEDDRKVLDEAVVIGYGTTTRKNLTTAIATIKPENISKAAVSNVSSLLLGRAAGLQATVSSTQPDGYVAVSIRGAGTPIYVIDGVVMPAGSLEPGAGSSKLPSSISRSGIGGLNPDDIESIEVLKDASAAIYGIGASNGVILITTESKTVENFLKMIDDAISQSNTSLEKARKSGNLEGKVRNDANRSTKQQLGISLDKAQSMGDGELERLGESKANAKLKSLGINKSAKELANKEELSEKEQQQIANSMAKQTSGMSMKELQALSEKLENMSEEEQIAYMQSSGTAQKMAAKAPKVQQPATNMKNVNALSFQYSEEWQANAKKLLDIEHNQDNFYVQLQEKWVSNGYQRRTAALMQQISQVVAPTPEEGERIIAALEAQIRLVCEEYCRESAKEWSPYIMQKLSIIKQMLQEDKMADAQSTEMMKLGGLESAEVLGSTSGAAISRAFQYLEAAKELVAAPRYGELQPIPNS